MKILFCAWGNICEPDMILSLQYMGHEVSVLREKIKNNDYDNGYLKLLSDTLLEEKAECVFSTNFIPIISRVCMVHQIKYISWTVDSPWFQFFSDTVKNTCNYIFIFDRCLYEKFKDKAPERIYYMPLGTNVKYWDSVKITKEDRERFGTDVSFVGSLYEDKHDYDKVSIPDYLRGYLDGVIEAQSEIYGYNFYNEVISDAAVDEFAECACWNTLGRDYTVSNREIVMNEFIGKKCAEVERHKFVDMLAKQFKFDLYTLSNTDCMPYLKNRGGADSRVDMPKIFKCSKINLNMTIKTIESGIPLRIYDILGCKGFLITNYQAEIPEYFIPGEDLVVYESLEDLKNKIVYYLSHEEERKAIAENGYKKVKALYTYEHRLKEIMQTVWSDWRKWYGNSGVEIKKQYIGTVNILQQLQAGRVLDAGLFLARHRHIADSYKVDLQSSMKLDGVRLLPGNELAEAELYDCVYNIKELPEGQHEIILAVHVLRYFKAGEWNDLLHMLGRAAGVIITEYSEEYESNIAFKMQRLDVGMCELLLISIS